MKSLTSERAFLQLEIAIKTHGHTHISGSERVIQCVHEEAVWKKHFFKQY